MSQTIETAPGVVDPASLEFLGAVPLTLQAELGRRTISGKQLLDMGPGSVIVLPTIAGENIAIFIQDVPLGSGEVLVFNDTLAVHVAEIKGKSPEGESERPKQGGER